MSQSSSGGAHRHVGYQPAPTSAPPPHAAAALGGVPPRGSRQQRLKQQQQQQKAAALQHPRSVASSSTSSAATPASRGNPRGGGGGGARGNPQPQPRVQGRHTVVHDHSDPSVSRHREAFDRSGRLLTLGTVFMLFGLVLYFGGGFLFVAAYNGIYPIFNIPVEPTIHRYYWWLGPILFFIGLFMFIVAFASFCKGLRWSCGSDHPEGYF